MSADEIEVAAAAAENTSAMYAAMRQLKSKQWGNPQPKIERIQRERKARASVERIDGRSIRAGSERTEQLTSRCGPN